MKNKTGRTALSAAVLAPVLILGLGVGAGPVSAATPPTISITTGPGPTEWTVEWDGTPAADCAVWVDGTAVATTASGVRSGPLPDGTYPTYFECPPSSGNVSPTVTLYAPRNPLNDLRTQISNDTQGMFGS
ncbi:hypothetical protein [Rhodococcus sp. NPDC058521]|uniref:hypothetical protein n=1 Tax=Rhodococcus sp. NPDC058521 TaxID=3346536 RepID=UPI00365D1385